MTYALAQFVGGARWDLNPGQVEMSPAKIPFFSVPAQESTALSSVGYDCKQCCCKD